MYTVHGVTHMPLPPVYLSSERSPGNIDKVIPGAFFLGHGIQNLDSLLLGQIETFSSNPWVKSISDIYLSLLEELSNDKDVGGSSVTGNIILEVMGLKQTPTNLGFKIYPFV